MARALLVAAVAILAVGCGTESSGDAPSTTEAAATTTSAAIATTTAPGGLASASSAPRPAPPTTDAADPATTTDPSVETTVAPDTETAAGTTAGWLTGARATPTRTNDWGAPGPVERPVIAWRTSDEVLGAPVAVDGVLYAAFADQTLRAIDVRTGQVRWSRETGAGGDTPTVTEDAVWYVDRFDLVAVDRATGTDELARIPPPDDLATSSFPDAPTVVGGVAYVEYSSLADDVWTNTLVAVDLEAGRPTWRWASTSGRAMHPVIVAGDTVVVVEEHDVLALDARLGIERWSTTLTGDLSPNISLVADDALVVFDGRLRVFELRDGAQRWSSADGSLQHAASGPLLFTQELDVRAFHLPTGRVEWESSWDGQVLSDAISVGGEVVYVHGTQGGDIAAFDRSTGTPLWRLTHDDSLRAGIPLLAHDGVLVAVENDRQLVAFI